MQPEYFINVYLGLFICQICSLDNQNVCTLCNSINYHPYRVMMSVSMSLKCDVVRVDYFLIPSKIFDL